MVSQMRLDKSCVLWALILLLLLSSSVVAKRRPDLPHVVLILIDNHEAWTVGCYGNRNVRTPHTDRLAKEVMLLTRAFANNPVCSPTPGLC